MQKDSRIKSFEDLAKFRDSFESDKPVHINYKKNFKTTLPASKGLTTSICGNKPITDLAEQSTKEFKVSLHATFCSKNSKKLKFSNYLKEINHQYECNAIRKIYSLNGKICKTNEIPFNLHEESLDVYDRQSAILDLFSITNKQNISKATYIDPIIRDHRINHKDNNLIRVFFEENNSELKILLLDPHHLLATTKLEKYEEVGKYSRCITMLRNK